MNKAEERALEKYPIALEQLHYLDKIEANKGQLEVDINRLPRIFFKEGYKQAEKDLALNIDDIEKIHTFLYAVKNNKTGAFTFTRLSDKQYAEVLRRFNEQRKK